MLDSWMYDVDVHEHELIIFCAVNQVKFIPKQ